MSEIKHPRCTAIFGASGGIGQALCDTLERRGTRLWRLSRSPVTVEAGDGRSLAFDLEDEPSIAQACAAMKGDLPDWTVIATGALTLDDGTGPERSIRQLDPAAMTRAMQINAIGPALIAKHMLPRYERDRPVRFAALSARVGSISDNRIGGWHSYRASKAALNMLIRNLGIEFARTHPGAVIVGLHPGTIDTALSAPFQANLPPGQLREPAEAATNLLSVMAALGPRDSGGLFDWQGARIEP